ncbi:MAG: hypothetical protein WCO03_01185 [bacterium]
MPKLREQFADPIYWYFVVLFVALLAGWYLSGSLAFLAGHSTLILGIIFPRRS